MGLGYGFFVFVWGLVEDVVEEGDGAVLLAGHDVGIDLGGMDGGVAHEGGAGVEVDAGIEGEDGKGVTGGVVGDFLGDAGRSHPGGHGLAIGDSETLEDLVIGVEMVGMVEPLAGHTVEGEV